MLSVRAYANKLSSLGVLQARNCSTARTISPSTFISNIKKICPNDHEWCYYERPEIEPNTILFETFYGQSSMLVPVNYDEFYCKHPEYSSTHNNESERLKNYNECVKQILDERLTQVKQSYDMNTVLIGNVNKDIKDYIMTDDKYANADKTLIEKNSFVLYRESLDEFAKNINLSHLESNVIDFDYYDKSDNMPQFMMQIRESKYELIMKELNSNDLANVVSLNDSRLYGVRDFDFYVENCLTYPKVPRFGAFSILPPSSIFGPRLALIGCAFVHICDLSIGGISVNKHFREKGIASGLMYQCAKEMIDENGFNMVYTHIVNDNEIGKAFLNKIGWKQIETPRYWITLGYGTNISD